MSRSIKVVLFAAEIDTLDSGKKGRVIRIKTTDETDIGPGDLALVKSQLCEAYSQRGVADRGKTLYPCLDQGFFLALESGLVEEVEVEVNLDNANE